MIQLSNSEFDKLVTEALESLPEEFDPYMENLTVEVQQRPGPKLLREMDIGPDELLMGLYQGVR